MRAALPPPRRGEHRLLNLAQTGATSEFMSFCAAAEVPPEADLVLVSERLVGWRGWVGVGEGVGEWVGG